MGGLLRPCRCASKVHIKCLNQWWSTGINPLNLTRCEVCLYRYKYHGCGTPFRVRRRYWTWLCFDVAVFAALAVMWGLIIEKSRTITHLSGKYGLLVLCSREHPHE